MGKKLSLLFISLVSILVVTIATADSFTPTIKKFKSVHATQSFFKHAYGYAVFPTVGSGAIGIGGAYGKGRVFKGGVFTGTVKLVSLSVGIQLGGKAFSEIIFFENKAAYNRFTRHGFSFEAKASATVLTLGANAQVGTSGTTSSAGLGALDKDAKPVAGGGYANGMATFILAKGGLKYTLAIGGQKFYFKPK